jgi:hypothetical protein
VNRPKNERWRSIRAEKNSRIKAAKHKSSGTNYNKIRIMVTWSDGKVINNPDAIDTFAEVISRIGYDDVEALGIMFRGKYPLVAREDINGKYRKEKFGWYVLSNCPNTDKAIFINEIADALDKKIYAEIIAK